jgi:hypothetical protein
MAIQARAAFGGLLASLACAAVAQAQSPPLRDFCPDRPGKGSPTCVVDPGVVQVEVGLFDASFSRSGPGSSDTYLVSDLQLRLGLTPMTEAQVLWAPFTRISDRSAGRTTRTEGVGDVTLALRRSLRNPDGSGLSAALQPFVSVPTGKTGVGAGGWQGGLIAPVSIPLAGDLSLGVAPEIDVLADADGDGSHWGWAAAVGLSKPVGAVTLGLELWAALDDDPADRVTQASIDLTLAWAPPGWQDLQFDVGVYGGLTADTPDLAVGIGLSRRF